MSPLFNFVALLAVVFWCIQIVMYLAFEFAADEREAHTTLHINFVMSLVAAFLFGAIYVAWEIKYGSAFRYFVPLHGSVRLSAAQWRAGIFIKSLFVANLILALLSIFFTYDFTFTHDGTRVLTPITRPQLLIFAVCQNFCLTILLLYVVALQYYHFS